MGKTLDYILKKYKLDPEQKSPLTLPISRFKGLPRLFKELGFKAGAEIGVLQGKYSKVLCRAIPELKLYSIDAWRDYRPYGDFRGQEKFDVIYEEVKTRLAPYNCEVIRKLSMDAVKDFEDESLDFVFIDANHAFEYVTEDIAGLSKKVRKGGIVSGHDFFRSGGRMRHINVKDVVQAWTYSHKIKTWFVIGKKEDKYPSWMWVKE